MPFSSYRLYLIEILHQTTTMSQNLMKKRKLYLIEILHQTTTSRKSKTRTVSCILSKFYIKPQLLACYLGSHFGCILSKFYIKPQPSFLFPQNHIVVSYRNSTSNHNLFPVLVLRILLYLIEILHQTTTVTSDETVDVRCILSKFYIKPQPAVAIKMRSHRCILSKFYIKPQPSARRWLQAVSLYLIEILHQTTTSGLILIDKVLLTGCLPL